MKLKHLITVLVLVALFSGVVLWRVDRFVYGDRMAWAEAQARGQLSSLSQAINGEIQSARRMLNTVSNETFRRETANWKAFQPYYALALMTTQGGSLGISRMVSREDSPAANWTANELSQYIGFMGKELESRGTVLLRSFKGPQKDSHVAVIFAGGGNAYILVGSGENFQSLIESQKGSISAFSIMASDGLMISHAMPEYIGSVMSDSTLLKEIRSTGSAHGLGAYQQGKQKIFGMYEQVPGTNTYVTSTVPMSELLKGRLSLAWQFGFMLVGLAFLGAAIYFWQERKASEIAANAGVPPEQASAPPVISTSFTPGSEPPPNVPLPIVETAQEPLAAPKAPTDRPANLNVPGGATTPQELQAEKADAYRQIAAALGQELRTPLASILGFSQMVLAKTQEPEVVQAVESILREARSSRDVLEKLVTFTGERSTEKTESKIEGPLMQALKNLDAKIQQKGIKIEKDFKETSPWLMASSDLTKAFENIFANAIEAMERMQDKVIAISTWEDEAGLHVKISDTGEGIEMENVSKVFDPFFTTRSFAHHVGLGLPMAAGIFKEHQAQMQIQSQRGKGTQVSIVFAPRKVMAEVAETSLPKPPPPVTAPDLPMDLPKIATPTQEDVALQEKIDEDTQKIVPKLTDVNVDRLLELQEEDEEMKLEFLEGQGFDDPPPTAPLPKPAPVVAAAPAAAPPLAGPPTATPPVAVPPVAAPPAAAPPAANLPGAQAQKVVLNPPEELTVIVPPEAEAPAVEAETKIMSSLVIDKPTLAAVAVKAKEIDSYKVEVRKPGKRT